MANKSKLIGREKTLERLKAVPQRIRVEARKAIEQGAAEIVAMQKRMVPSDTGALRDSIQYVFGNVSLPSTGVLSTSKKRRGGSAASTQGDADLSATIIAGNREAYYARFVEYGTKARPQGGWAEGTLHEGTHPRPFFYGPFRTLRRKVRSRITRATNKAIKAAAK